MHFVDAPVTLTWDSPTAAAATVEVWNSDGTPVTPDPTVTTTGAKHTASFTPTMPGMHRVRWSTPDNAYATVVDVWPEDPRYIVAVEEAATTVGGFTAVATRDAISLLVATATWMIEHPGLAGPVLPTEHTHVATGGGDVIALPHTRVTVSTVTVNGLALAADGFDVDELAGVVYSTAGVFASGRRFNVAIAYTVGSAIVPANIRTATLDLVAHLWRSSRYTGRPSEASPAADTVATPFGFAVPKRVLELCSAVPSTPGFG